MVRTKADRVPTKAVGSKAPAKSVKSTPTKKVAGSSKGKSHSGGNPYHPRATPEWQKPITCFINQNATNKVEQENEDEGTSKEANNESD
ncbi:uncharacterized protein LOC105663333 isoform X1 [Megachile rotundata]|uniref:uncharacterized protein LOC105663333 isoform X1 n=1 Tax=Megachile rotundata TaxID=143995 RepID=UPI003FD481D2